MKTAALFAGIAGLELGLHKAGFETVLFCENNPSAAAVLKHHFPHTPLVPDVRDLDTLPTETELLTAGFPCQDLSQAGKTSGIHGAQSGLVGEVLRLLETFEVPHVLLENVPFMLQLDRGRAIAWLVGRLEALGYHWAYRVVDSRAFGIPQRRERVFLFASKTKQPEKHLFKRNCEPRQAGNFRDLACGFYWTEGLRGLGWAVDSIPTLKGGSTIGIASPPAIWLPNGHIVTPDLRDAERLQGFPADWTRPAESVDRSSFRWKLVGNAVTVAAAEWVGKSILGAPNEVGNKASTFDQKRSWPKAAFGTPTGERHTLSVTTWPAMRKAPHLEEFLRYEPKPLSHRAVTGFMSRLKSGTLRYPPEFLEALENHQAFMEEESRLRETA